MMAFETLPLDKLYGEFPCECGRTHRITTRQVLIERGIIGRLPALLSALGDFKRIALVYDDNTLVAAGAKAIKALAPHYALEAISIGHEGQLHADEEALGTLMMGMGKGCDLILAVGTGTLNDLCRYAAYMTKIPFVLLGTAPSMDGLCSSVSPLLQRGLKTTFEAASPLAVYMDLDVMERAPQAMIAAGLGDMAGKFTALRDWELAEIVEGEYRCPALCRMMEGALNRCLKSAPGLHDCREDALYDLTYGLILSGLAMQMMGNSRPASGCEHHLSHFWEMRAHAAGQAGALHGDKVGVAEILMIDFYNRFYDDLREIRPVDVEGTHQILRRALGPVGELIIAQGGFQPDPEHVKQQRQRVIMHFDHLKARARELVPLKAKVLKLIQMAGGPVDPREMGLTKAEVMDAILSAMHVRTRFTLLRMAYEWGIAEEIAKKVVEETYAK